MSCHLISNARPEGGDPADLLVVDGRIAAVGAPGSLDVPADAEVLDASGLIALPGLVDMHTHLREPARGGYTAVFAMANSNPVADTAGVVEQVWQLGRDAGWADVHPVGAVTVGLEGEQLSEIRAMAESRAGVRMFSDDGKCVHDPVLMRRALEYVKAFDGIIAQHAQEPRLTEGAQMNEGTVSADLGLTGWPAVAEETIIARDVLLAQHVDSRLHICHLSTAGSVEIVRWAKERGVTVTAEATPHHLLLTDELVRTFDPVYKVNPPLRTDEDVQALRRAVAEGTIDVIGTDHAPHTTEDKECEWSCAAHGMTGLETALAVVQHALVDTGMIGWERVAQIMSRRPAQILGLTDQGQDLAPGSVANIVLWDPAGATPVDPAHHASKARNSPYRGMTLPGGVRATFYRGHPVVRDGELTTPVAR